MSDCLTAVFNGFSFVDNRSNGDVIYVSDTPGWEEGAEVDYASVARGGSHGTFSTPVWERARPFAIEGRAECVDHLSMVRLQREMRAAVSGGVQERMYIGHEGDVTLWADAHITARPSFIPVMPTIFDFRLSFEAPDAFRYGETSTASTTFATDAVGVGLVFPLFDPADVLDFGPVPTSDGSATVVNNGSASASPVFTVAGPTPVGGFSITDLGSGERLRFLGVVPDGSTLVLDASDGSVVLNGTADRSSDLISSRWPSVAPGSQVTYRFAPESSPSAATLTVDLVSTYW